MCFFFFFSSRRRHTRWPRDWSSDVCSSDLGAVGPPKLIKAGTVAPHGFVSFVDEAIHHSTPLIGHREVSATNVRLFLENETPFKDHYKQALAAWNKSQEKPVEVKPGFLGSLFGSKPKQ